MEPTLSQYKATAKFHRRVEVLYRQVGRLTDAESAKKAAEILEAKIKELASRETA